MNTIEKMDRTTRGFLTLAAYLCFLGGFVCVLNGVLGDGSVLPFFLAAASSVLTGFVFLALEDIHSRVQRTLYLTEWMVNEMHALKMEREQGGEM